MSELEPCSLFLVSSDTKGADGERVALPGLAGLEPELKLYCFRMLPHTALLTGSCDSNQRRP